MDKVDDQSQTNKGVASFQKSDSVENGEASSTDGKESAKKYISSTSLGVPLDQVEWDKHPPVVEMKVNTSYLNRKKMSERATTINKVLTLVIAIIVVVLVWGGFLLPHLCYFKLGLCSGTVASDAPGGNGGNVPQYLNCSGHEYTGSVCQPYFNTCTNSLINIDADMDINIQLLFSQLDRNGSVSASCKGSTEILKTFVCQAAYQPCDSANNVIQPARHVCEDLRDNTCSSEWEFVENAFSDLVPDCSSLPVTPLVPNCTNEIPAPTTPTEEQDDTNTQQCTEDYEGTVCTEYLSICPDNQINQYDSAQESTLQTAFFLLQSASGPCLSSQELVKNFVCMYVFEPCDTEGNVHRANRSTCELITMDLCAAEVMQLQSVNIVFDCSSLPETSTTPLCNDSNIDPSPDNPTTSLDISSLLQCDEEHGFFLYIGDNATINNTCQARCSEWTIYENKADAIPLDIAVMVAVCLGMIGGFAMIFFSIMRYNKMFKFPNTFLFCLTLVLLFLAATVVVQYIDPDTLSCASDDLVATSLQHPTTFCTISGFIVMYSITGLVYWWFVHVSVTFYKVMFPFHARSYEKYENITQTVLIIVGIVLPILPPVIAYIFDGFILTRFPPILCSPRNDLVAYLTLLLPISVITALGITFLIVILYVLKQKQRLFKHRDSRAYWLGLSTAEKKLLAVFFYYILLGVMAILAYSITITTLDSVVDAIYESFQCELLRTDLNKVCPKHYSSLRLGAALGIIVFIILGLFTYFNLLYALNFGEIKAKLLKCIGRKADSGQSTRHTRQSVVDAPDTPFTLRRRLTYTISQTSHPANGTIGRSGIYTQKTTDL